MNCGAVGAKGDWKKASVRYPVCNRPLGHDGPHQVWDRFAFVKAEWSPFTAPPQA